MHREHAQHFVLLRQNRRAMNGAESGLASDRYVTLKPRVLFYVFDNRPLPGRKRASARALIGSDWHTRQRRHRRRVET